MKGLLATLGGLASGSTVSLAPGQGGSAEFGDRSGSLLGPGGGRLSGGGGLGGGGGVCGGGEGLKGAGQLKQGGLGDGGELSFPGVSVTWVPGIYSSAEHVCSHNIQSHLRIELMYYY